jgi:hypothetical protein
MHLCVCVCVCARLRLCRMCVMVWRWSYGQPRQKCGKTSRETHSNTVSEVVQESQDSWGTWWKGTASNGSACSLDSRTKLDLPEPQSNLLDSSQVCHLHLWYFAIASVKRPTGFVIGEKRWPWLVFDICIFFPRAFSHCSFKLKCNATICICTKQND